MNCSRCGAAEAVLKRDAAFYCGKCALARDWEEVIALVQEERVSVGAESAPTIDFGAPNGSSPEPVVAAAAAPAAPTAPAPPAPAAPAPTAPAAPAPPAPAAVAPPPPVAAPIGPADLPADPFA